MSVQRNLGVDDPAATPAEEKTPAPEVPAEGADTDANQALRLAVSQQAELLALLAGSIRAEAGALSELRPLDTVRLADLDAVAAVSVDPLLTFGAMAPHVAQEADRVIEDLGGRPFAA